MIKAKALAGKAGFVVKKYSPEILAGVGTVCIVTGTVIACKQTLKATEVMKAVKADIETIHEAKEAVEEGKIDEETYSVEDYKKDLTTTYMKAAVDFVKLYAPAVIFVSLGLGCMLGSNGILKKRNASLAAAYATLDSMYKSYRKNVIEKYGKDVDRNMRYGITKQEVEVTTVDEKGKEKTKKETVNVVNPNGISDYARIFDKGHPEWEPSVDYNLTWLKAKQSYLTDRLRIRGYLFLNEVYSSLGFPETVAGQSVGWIYDEKNPIGDNYVDFGLYEGLYDPEKIKNNDFINGIENSILLDFNVDGDILHNPRLRNWNFGEI